MSGDVMSTRIEDLIAAGTLTINDGYRAKNSELSTSGLPFARAQNINNGFRLDNVDRFPEENIARVGAKISREGDVVFTSKGTVGRFAIVRSDTPRFVYSPQLCFWRSTDRDRIDPEWLFYWMQSREFYVQYAGVAGQTDMAEYVSLRDQRMMNITLPPIEEQRAIAHILGTLDNKIELNQRMNETLEKLARAIFKSWFVDFDPVRAKAEGRDPGLPKHIADLFPNRFEDSELGEIPAGWRICSISDVCENIFSGGTPRTTSLAYWGGDIPWLSSGETRSKFIVGTEKTITLEGVSNSSTRLARTGATVIASAGQGSTRGQTAMLMLDSYINQSVVALVADKRFTSDAHLFFDLERRYEQFRQVSDAYSSRGSLTTKLLGSLQTTVPPRSLIGAFDDIAVPIVHKITRNLNESRTIIAIRDALLPRLISGELQVEKSSVLDGED